MLKRSLGLTAFFSCVLLSTHVFSEELTVNVSSIESNEGSIYIQVWDSKTTWLKVGGTNVRKRMLKRMLKRMQGHSLID
jgi:uncharacterized protein (DUF2141 family)